MIFSYQKSIHRILILLKVCNAKSEKSSGITYMTVLLFAYVLSLLDGTGRNENNESINA